MIRKITNIDGTVRYQARVTVLGQRLFKKFETRQAAAEWVNKMRFKRDTKTPCFQKVIIDDMFNHYLENAKNKGNAISTIKRAICTFKTHLKPFYNDGDMAKDGYIYMSVENRGAPAPKGREWRKSIYKNIGIMHIEICIKQIRNQGRQAC